MLVVTTEGIPGYEIRRVIGEVVGVTAKTVNAYAERIRGFGHVKQAQARPALAERDRLLAALRQPAARPALAEAAE